LLLQVYDILKNILVLKIEILATLHLGLNILKATIDLRLLYYDKP